MRDSHFAESVDRLSELPNSLILSILSLLPITDAIRTTILSTRWKDVWTTVPCLHFNNRSDNDLDKFRYFVYSALVHWKGAKVLKLTIDFAFNASLTSYVDSLLLFAIYKQVEELQIDLPVCRSESSYKAHQFLYSCSFLRKLTLFCVELNVGERVRWNLLKSLTIDGVDSVTEHAMNQIISGAPLLEVLTLLLMEIKENLNVRSTSLKTLTIEIYYHCFCINVEKETFLGIWAPNLENLKLSAVSYTRCLINVPSLKNARLGFDKVDYFFEDYSYHLLSRKMWRNALLRTSHVENLTSTYWCIKLLLERKQESLPLFSNAKFLNLYRCDGEGMLDVLGMFPKLVMLIVECKSSNELVQLVRDEEHDDVETDSRKTILPTVSLLQLKTVEITWPSANASIFPIIEFLLENSRVLEKMMLRLITRRANLESFDLVKEKVLSMPRSSPYAEVIISKE